MQRIPTLASVSRRYIGRGVLAAVWREASVRCAVSLREHRHWLGLGFGKRLTCVWLALCETWFGPFGPA
jgi:hypothetical protein